MSNLSFLDLNLTPKVKKAVDDLGFIDTTSIQSQAIPIIRTGVDVIGRSQTGTGKTIAFAIPAIERIDTHEEKPTVQVLILCPTRELACQGSEEIKKLTKYKSGVHPVEVYGGAAMDRQIYRLKKANMVIGTPGRIMDHMRRGTLKLNNLKMIVLDEADEMLSMGFKEDIETILKDTPENRQTILFSATMPPSIMSITKQFQKNPTVIEINKKQVTLDNIEQYYVDVPMGRKNDALNLLLKYYNPDLSIIFCNTKKMVEDVVVYLQDNGFKCDGLHGDMKQSQRTTVMEAFKAGKIGILVATDVAARGIDVNNVEYVINYDIPQNNEYYVHRIGRTGRAGKSGIALTICSGKRQAFVIRNIASAVKSEIKFMEIPKVDAIETRLLAENSEKIESLIGEKADEAYVSMVSSLLEKGHSLYDIALAAVQFAFPKQLDNLNNIESKKYINNAKQKCGSFDGKFSKIALSIGRTSHVAPNHIVAAITERTQLTGGQIGKIEIYDDFTVVSVPGDTVTQTLEEMAGGKICGKPIRAEIYESHRDASQGNNKNYGSQKNRSNSKPYSSRSKEKFGGRSSEKRDYKKSSDRRKPLFSGKKSTKTK